MGHFAKVINGVVTQVVSGEASFFESFEDGTPGEWVETSFFTRGNIHYQPDNNTPSEDQTLALRGNYAAKGDIYDSVLDAFYKPQPYNSWNLNTGSFLWQAPVDYPSGDVTGSYTGSYRWDEDSVNWVTGSL